MSGKKIAVIGVILVLILGGGLFGVHSINQNKETFQGISLPLQGVSDEQRERWLGLLDDAMKKEEVLKVIVETSDYQSLMGSESEEAAVADLGKRIQVNYRERKGTMEIGLGGKRKEVDKLKEVAPEIYKILANYTASMDPEFSEFVSSR